MTRTGSRIAIGFLVGLCGPGVFAADARDPLSNFILLASSNSVDYQLTEMPASHSSDPNILDNRARGTFVISNSPTDTWSIRQSVGEFDMSHAPVIAQTGLRLPTSLWDVETGVGYQHTLGDRRSWGISTSVGSASDQLFHSIHETTFRGTGAYRIPSGATNSWLFLLSYSNNRHFANNVPFPGVAYILHTDHLDAALGIPFLAVSYRPLPDMTGRFSIFGPQNFSAEWAYRLWKPVEAFVGFDWGQQEWLRANREDNSDRLFYDQKKWVLGVHFPLLKQIRLDLSANYEFNRRFYEETHAASRDIPEANLNAGWAFQARFSKRW